MDQEKIGRFIAALRKERSLTQRELAQQLGVSDKTVSKWETGRGLPEISIMQTLCQTFGISINELLSGGRLDASAYRQKAEENITALMQRKSYKKVAIHMALSTAPFLASFLTFPLVAERVIPPLSIPIILFWSILLIVGNFIAGMTYGILGRWSALRLICICVFNVLLLVILITVFAIAGIVFSAF